jgi:hypothetical protein
MLIGRKDDDQDQSLGFIHEPLDSKSMSPEKEQLLRNNNQRKFVSVSNKAGILLIDFEGEEDRDREGARLALVKYRPLLDYLFDKYTAKAQLKNKIANIGDHFGER